MSMKSRILASVGGVGLTLAVAVTAVTAGGPLSGFAAQSASPSSTPVASSTPVTSTAARPGAAFGLGGFGSFGFGGGVPDGAMGDPAQCEDVQSKLAANLGVTTDALEAAVKKTIIQEIDEAEKDGKLTADQAKTARDRVNSVTDLCAGFGLGVAGPGMVGPGDKGGTRPAPVQGGDVQFGMINRAAYETVAKYFGITTDQLKQDISDLGSLQAVAAKYGKDTAAGKAGLQAEIEKALNDELAQRGVPQEMIDRIVSEFSANFDTIYTTKLNEGPHIHVGPGQRGPRTTPSPSPTSSTH